MTDIIKFDWNNEYAVDDSFDLNQLRKFKKVKSVNSNYVFDEKDSGMTIEIGKPLLIAPEEIEENEKQELIKDKENYKAWYNQEQSKANKLKNELDCIKKQLAELVKSEEGGEPKDETTI